MVAPGPLGRPIGRTWPGYLPIGLPSGAFTPILPDLARQVAHSTH